MIKPIEWMRWRWRHWHTSLERDVLLGALDASLTLPPRHPLVSFLGTSSGREPVHALHGQMLDDPPNFIDWTRVLVPPEAYWCAAIVNLGDAHLVLLGDRHGNYSSGHHDLETNLVTLHIGVQLDRNDSLRELFGTFAQFHEAFHG